VPGTIQFVSRRLGAVTPQPVWHGTHAQAIELMNAIAGNCACELDAMGARVSTCAAHAMFEDQRLLDGLAFGRYLAKRLVQQEYGLDEMAWALGHLQTS
jgi:hypothetical protein